jgi:hypothetical protein
MLPLVNLLVQLKVFLGNPSTHARLYVNFDLNLVSGKINFLEEQFQLGNYMFLVGKPRIIRFQITYAAAKKRNGLIVVSFRLIDNYYQETTPSYFI